MKIKESRLCTFLVYGVWNFLVWNSGFIQNSGHHPRLSVKKFHQWCSNRSDGCDLKPQPPSNPQLVVCMGVRITLTIFTATIIITYTAKEDLHRWRGVLRVRHTQCVEFCHGSTSRGCRRTSGRLNRRKARHSRKWSRTWSVGRSQCEHYG